MNDVHMNGVHIMSMALWKQVGGRLAGKDPERSTLLFRREGGAMSSKKAISRNRIIEVAFGMARESGLPSLSVRAIAEACGVATGTIYNHVPDVAELRTEVLQRFWREAIEAAELETCTRDAETALDYCRRLSDALSSSLEGFRTAWLRDMGALDGRTRQRTMEAERACLGDLHETVRHAFERDAAITSRARDRVQMDAVVDFAWQAMLDAMKRGDGSCETLFALMELALYT